MTALTEQEGKWVDNLAGRLRLIQAGAASAPADKRREYLQEEVARQFKDVPAANRRRFLGALIARFPVRGRPPEAAAAPVREPPPPAPLEETPAQILDRFLAAAAHLPQAERSDLSRRLAEHGLAWVDRDALVVEVSDELRKKLGMPADRQVHLNRLVDLAITLTDVVSRLNQRALATLRELSPRSPLLKRPADFQPVAGQYLAGDLESVESQLKQISALLGAVMAATLAGSKEFGKQHFERFSPAVIEGVIAMEGGKLFGPGKKERCWDKYAELANDYVSPDIIDRQLKDCLAKFIERIAGGP